MFAAIKPRDKVLLSRRTRIFIRVHHLVILVFIGWIAYLFYARELV